MVNNYAELNQLHKDVLKEMGNIGTGNALTSLSQLTDRPIQMDLPNIRVAELDELPETLNRTGAPCAGVVLEVHGDIEGVVTFLLSKEFTCVMANELTGEPVEDITSMTDMQQSALCEIGNIMCNSYLNALASMLEANLTVSLPAFEIGSSGDVLSKFSKQFEDEIPEVLFIENTFHYLGQEFVSYILLHPKFESLKKILEKLQY